MLFRSHQPYLSQYIDQFTRHGGYACCHLLSNCETPREYIVTQLRFISGKKNIPRVNVVLDKALLSELPPVMRLELFKSLFDSYRKNIIFSDIKTEEDLSALLFGTAIKYNHRVAKVIEKFKYLYRRNDEQSS